MLSFLAFCFHFERGIHKLKEAQRWRGNRKGRERGSGPSRCWIIYCWLIELWFILRERRGKAFLWPFIHLFMTTESNIYLRYATLYIIYKYIYSKRITLIKLTAYSSLPILTIPSLWVERTAEIYFLSKFQVYNTFLLLTIITMLYIKSSELTHLLMGSLYPLINISPCPPPLSLW